MDSCWASGQVTLIKPQQSLKQLQTFLGTAGQRVALSIWLKVLMPAYVDLEMLEKKMLDKKKHLS